jgi:flagellar hook-associated protein 1
MPGLSQGLEIARRALIAHQSALNVTGNNIANVSTPGYTRQVVKLTPSPSERTPDGLVGTGVRMDGVLRARDNFLDAQVREEMGLAGKWSARSNILDQVEGVLNEPSDSGIASLLDTFWNSWLDLSNNPEDPAARSVVVQSGISLAAGLQETDARLRAITESIDSDLEQRVTHLNTLFAETAKLNVQISEAETGGTIDAALRDQRDLLLDELAKTGGATHLLRSDKSVVVRMGGRTVVEGDTTVPLATMRYNDDGRVRVKIIFESDRTSPGFLSGELAGMLELRDREMPGFLDKMDQMTSTLTQAVNRIHEAGPSHLPFFRGNRAQSLEVVPEITNDTSQVNAGTTGDSGDNDIALAVAALRDARVLNRNTASISTFYRGFVSEIGALGQQAKSVSASQEQSVQTIEGQRQSVIGVNLDEELTRMMSTQKAFEAAARVFGTVSDMFDTLLAM